MKRFTLAFAAGVALLATSAAQAIPPSGMLLGVYAFPTWEGLRVTGTIPGYSADGRIFPNDMLLRVTPDGVSFYETMNLWQIEHAKDRIGPFRPAALELFRPGVGLTYLWVEFQPVGGPVAYSRRGGPVQMQAKVMTEAERPGARALFQRGTQYSHPNTQVNPQGPQNSNPNTQVNPQGPQYSNPNTQVHPQGQQNSNPNTQLNPQGQQNSTPNMGTRSNQGVFPTGSSGSTSRTGLRSDPAKLFGR